LPKAARNAPEEPNVLRGVAEVVNEIEVDIAVASEQNTEGIVRMQFIPADIPEQGVTVHKLPVTIGRGSDTTVRVDDPYTSRRHCEINRLNGALVVRDLNTTNGTFVNGLRITESHILPGDRLTVGETRFLVHYEDSARILVKKGRRNNRHLQTGATPWLVDSTEEHLSRGQSWEPPGGGFSARHVRSGPTRPTRN
jgi:hypothetical protein